MGKRTARTDELEFALELLKAAGVSRARVAFDEHGPSSLEVEFGPPAPAAATPLGLVDKDGNPVDLDEGMGVLEQDPLDEEIPPDAMQAANYPRKPRRAAS